MIPRYYRINNSSFMCINNMVVVKLLLLVYNMQVPYNIDTLHPLKRERANLTIGK